MDNSRKYNIILITLFVAVIAGIPLVQILIEMKRDGRAQFTDLFRYAPSTKNLRAFETDLESESVFQQTLRPAYQRFLFSALDDAGSNGMIGQDDWLFYRPGVQYLVDADQVEAGDVDSVWVEPSDGTTTRDSVVRAIVQFRDQLRERDIELLVVPVPGKASVYPDRLTSRMENKYQDFQSPTLKFMDKLSKHGVECVDLFALYKTLRAEKPLLSESKAYYLARDTHWTPEGAKLGAIEVARRMRELGWMPTRKRTYQTREVNVTRYGDILEMLAIPGIRDGFPAEPVQCEQVTSPAVGLMIPSPSSSPGTFMNPMELASTLVLGDSYSRIYQLRESATLGSITDPAANTDQDSNQTRKLMPGSAGFISHLGLALEAPVDYIISDGGASTDVRRKLSMDAEILEGKNLVIWEFTERDIRLGAKGWQHMPLPPER